MDSFPWLSRGGIINDDDDEVVQNERTRLSLLEKRDRLKVLLKRAQDDVVRMKETRLEQKKQEEETLSQSSILERLLESNNSELVMRGLEKGDLEKEEEEEELDELGNVLEGNHRLISEDMFLPIRNAPESAFMLGLFHGLSFKPINSQLISRNTQVNEFKGSCFAYSGKVVLFNFYVLIRVKLPEQSVSTFRIRVSPWVRKEIGVFLNQMEEEGNISFCLHGLAQYGNLAMKRYQVFSDLAKKYKIQDKLWKRLSSILLKDGTFFFSLRWEIEIDEIGHVQSKPSISLKFPEGGKLKEVPGERATDY